MSPDARRDFGDYVEECKRAGAHGSGARGDFSYQELRELAKEFLGLEDE